jgi:hypothetical protein
MKKIRSINKETKEVKEYNSILEASRDIKTRMPEWKVQLNIVYALITGTRAYKCNWEDVK